MTIGWLDVDETVTLTFNYTIPEDAKKGDIIKNVVVAEADDGTGGEDGEEVTVLGDELRVIKTASTARANRGQEITYTITVTNTGDFGLEGVIVTETLTGGVFTYTGDKENVTIDGLVVTIGWLDVGETVTLIFKYTVPSNAQNGSVIINVVVAEAGDDIKDEDSKEVTVIVDSTPPGGNVTTGGGGGGGTTTIPEEEVPLIEFIGDHVAYIIGYPEGDVRPRNNITRAEVATIFFRLLTDRTRNNNWVQENPFSDVSMGSWYNNAVSVMNKMGIVRGYPDGFFKPNGAITRAELGAIAARFARAMNTDGDNETGFNDISGHWAESDILHAAKIGWVNGYPDGTFRPNQPITRAEVMTLANRMLQRVPKDAADVDKDWALKWPDNDNKDYWYYLAVQEATNSHEYDNHDEKVEGLNFMYEFWLGPKANRDWAQLEKEWAHANAGWK